MPETTSEPARVASERRRAPALSGVVMAALLVGLYATGLWQRWLGWAVVLALYGGWSLAGALYARTASAKSDGALGPATVPQLHEQALKAGGGAYLAHAKDGRWLSAPAQVAGLVLAGPRAGKSTCVVIPALLAHPGAALCTSTKPELLAATLQARRSLGRAWLFDLAGRGAPPGTQALRWSPLQRAADWQGAQAVAEAMAGAAEIEPGAGHWAERAGALLAACLHAAAAGGLEMSDVSSWVLRHDAESPLAELSPGTIAHDVLQGIERTADRERSGIFSTAARALRAYRSDAALAASASPNFDPTAFAASRETIYIACPAHEQALAAPLVVGLLTDIRHAVYAASFKGGRAPWPPVLFLLDECANVAPIPDLPAMLSEAGGQGLQAICVFQDMSQVRRRWPREADGFMSLFGARIVLAGVADPSTLQQLSLLCGDWDRPVQSTSEQKPAGGFFAPVGQRTTSESWSTRRERRVPPDRIAQLARGEALVTIGPAWELVPAVPYDRHPVFGALASGRE